jgi:hypothetical protein
VSHVFPIANALAVALELERRGVRHFACLGAIEVYDAEAARVVQELIAFGGAAPAPLRVPPRVPAREPPDGGDEP